MKLTTMTRYAVRAMADMAEQPQGKAIPLRDIAKRQSVKLKYLELIFFQLRKAKLIKTKKGPGGGYFLNRDPKLIKISDIMEAVGETRAPVLCVDTKKQKRCPRINRCPTRPYWNELRKTIDTFFDNFTLYEILKMHKQQVNK